MRWFLAMAEAFAQWRTVRLKARFDLWADRVDRLRDRQDRSQRDLFEGRD